MKSWLALGVVFTVAAGCVDSNAVSCLDGRLCPASTVCEDIHHICVVPAQLSACAIPSADGTCMFGETAGRCDQGVCLEARCGDGVRVGTEECDGADLGTVTSCTGLGYYDDGAVGCRPDCTYDVSACARICGDSIKDPEEACDRADTSTIADCRDLGFYEAGDVHCSYLCAPDVSACKGYCGDHVVQPSGGEACEPGGDPLVSTCLDYAFDAGRIACTGYCSPGFADCRSIGWERVVARDFTAYTALYVADTEDLFAATGYSIRHVVGGVVSEDGSPPAAGMNGLWGTSATNVWAAGFAGNISRFNGTTWTAVTSGTAEDLNAISGTSASNIYAVGNSGVIVHYNGTSWSAMTTPNATTQLRGVWAFGATAFAVGVQNGAAVVWRLVGTTWQAESVTGLGLTAVWGTSDTDVFAVGDGGVVLHRNASGWTAQDGDASDLYTVWGRASNDVYAAGINSNGTAGRLIHYDGHSWWPADSETVNAFSAISGGGGAMYGAGNAGTLLRYAGAEWERDVTIGSTTIDRVWALWLGADAAADYVVQGCNISRKDAYAFSSIYTNCSNGTPRFVGVYQTGAHIFVATDDGHVYHSSNNGSSFPDDTVLSSARLRSIHGTSSTNVFASGTNGATSLMYHFNGTAWAAESFDTPGFSARSVYAVGADAFAVGVDSLSNPMAWKRSGTTWVKQTLPANVNVLTSVWASSATDVYAVGNAGAAVHYDGTAWTKITLPISFDATSIAGSGPNDVWVVGKPSTILHFDGVAWTEVRSPVQVDFTAVAVRPERVLFGRDQGGVFALSRSAGW